jgi:hypothetical protein
MHVWLLILIIASSNTLEILEEECTFIAPQNSVLLSRLSFHTHKDKLPDRLFTHAASYTMGNENGFPG